MILHPSPLELDPGALLAQLGVPCEQVTSPTSGYDGTFTPVAVMAHWNASAAGSDTAAATVAGHDYHACVDRAGVVHLGGWKVKQAHGGSGRADPQSTARQGGMTADVWRRYHDDQAGDDNDSGANRDFYGVSIDLDGVGEVAGDAQWYGYTSALAVFLHMCGATGPAWLCDHASSTNRKVDLGPPSVSIDLVFADVATMLALLVEGPTAVTNRCVGPPAVHPAGGYAQVTSRGYVYVNGPGATYHGGAQDEPVVRDHGVDCTGIAWTPDGAGYYIGLDDGNVIARDAEWYGAAAPDMVP